MAAEWEKMTLGQLTENFDGQRVPVKETDRKPGPYPYYGASGVVDHVHKYIFDGEYLLIAEDGENLRTRKTPIAFLARGKFWVNNHAHIVTGNHRADTRFLMYALNNGDISGYLTGSAMPKLTQGNMNRIPILAPPLSEQAAIAAVLGALDDKIELNRRMNETLEAIARALFQNWFVDATQAGLPKDWTVRALYDCANYVNGSAFRHEHFSPERHGLPIIKIGELKDGVTGQTKFTEEILEEKYRVTTGDILFSWSGSPDTSIDTFVWTGRDGWLNQHIFKIQFKRPVEKFFVYYLLRHFKAEFIEIARNKQTTGLGHVTAQDLKRLKSAFPPDDVLVAFNRVAEPLFHRSYSNSCESHTLAALRDGLLPKLLSGELKTPASRS